MARKYSGSSDSGGSPRGERYSSSNSQSRTYTCKICGNGFNSGQSLGGHMNVHRRDPRSANGHCSRSSTPPAGDYNSTSYDPNSITYKGVRFRSEQHKWVAEIRPPKSNKTWWLGTYNTPVEAAYAYDVAITYFGSETSLNFDGHPVYDQIPRISSNLPKQDFAVQLRKVVKEYGKLAMAQSGGMQSHHQSTEEDEDDEEGSGSSTTSYVDQDTDSPYQQQEEYSAMREIDWDEFPDSFPEDQTESYDHDTPFDFEMAAPVAFESTGYNYSSPNSNSNYQPAASQYYAPSGVYNADYQPASHYETSGYYNQVSPPVSPQAEYELNQYYNQMPPAMSSDYGPSGYGLNGYQPQEQFWSPYCSQYSNY